MKMLQIEEEDDLLAWIDVTKPRADGMDTYQDGPVISSFRREFRGPPDGSVLYGRLYISPANGVDKFGRKKVYGRWDKVKLPDGRELPVCFRLGNPDGMAELDPTPPPGFARFSRAMPLVAVHRFVYE